MRIGVLTNLWRQGDLSVERLCTLRDEGLVEWVELRLPRSIDPLPERMKETLREAAHDLALPLSLHTEATTFAAHPDEAVRWHIRQTMLDTIRLAEGIGASVVSVHPPLSGPGHGLGAEWTPGERELLEEVARSPDGLAFEAAMETLDLPAHRAGVALAIENMRPRTHDAGISGVRELAEWLRKVNEPFPPWFGPHTLRLCLDVRKAFREGVEAASFIREHAELLAEVHAAGIGPQGRPAAIGYGGIDWRNVFGALRGIDYAGPVVYEGPTEATEESLRALYEARG